MTLKDVIKTCKPYVKKYKSTFFNGLGYFYNIRTANRLTEVISKEMIAEEPANISFSESARNVACKVQFAGAVLGAVAGIGLSYLASEMMTGSAASTPTIFFCGAGLSNYISHVYEHLRITNLIENPPELTSDYAQEILAIPKSEWKIDQRTADDKGWFFTHDERHYNAQIGDQEIQIVKWHRNIPSNIPLLGRLSERNTYYLRIKDATGSTVVHNILQDEVLALYERVGHKLN